MKERKLQSVRIIVQTISTILFPFSFYYLSPLIPLGGSTKGIVVGSLIIFGLLFLIALFFGRIFCSWLCPAGGIQDQIAQGRKKKLLVKKINWIKYIVWGIWLTVLLYYFREAGGIKSIEFAFATEKGMSTTSLDSLIIYGFVVISFMALSIIFGQRVSCHTICWISPFMILGKKLGMLLRLPMLHLKTRDEDCVGCGKCRTECPMSLNVPKLVLEGKIVDDDCILCGKCLVACPKNCISWTLGKTK